MNERLEELAKQAVFESYKNGQIDQKEIIMEKFAMLIIQECIRVPYDMWDKSELNADIAVKIENRIKEQFFGVE